MQHLKRLGWIFLVGFAFTVGAGVGVLLVVSYYAESKKQDHAVDPRDYAKPKPGEVVFHDLKVTKITQRGGVFGEVENRTSGKLQSIRADLLLSKDGALLHRCRNTVLVDIEPGARAPFELICHELDRSSLSDDMKIEVQIAWVYPARHE